MNGLFGHSSNFLSQWTFNKLTNWGLSDQVATYLNTAVLVILSVILVYIVQYLTRRIIYGVFNKVARFSNVTFFKYLVKNCFPPYLAQLLPYAIVKKLIFRT